MMACRTDSLVCSSFFTCDFSASIFRSDAISSEKISPCIKPTYHTQNTMMHVTTWNGYALRYVSIKSPVKKLITTANIQMSHTSDKLMIRFRNHRNDFRELVEKWS